AIACRTGPIPIRVPVPALSYGSCAAPGVIPLPAAPVCCRRGDIVTENGMYGWVDEDRGQWKNATGRNAPLPGTDANNWLCPVGEEFGVETALRRRGDPPFLDCSKGHAFDRALITDDGQVSLPLDHSLRNRWKTPVTRTATHEDRQLQR